MRNPRPMGYAGRMVHHRTLTPLRAKRLIQHVPGLQQRKKRAVNNDDIATAIGGEPVFVDSALLKELEESGMLEPLIREGLLYQHSPVKEGAYAKLSGGYEYRLEAIADIPDNTMKGDTSTKLLRIDEAPLHYLRLLAGNYDLIVNRGKLQELAKQAMPPEPPPPAPPPPAPVPPIDPALAQRIYDAAMDRLFSPQGGFKAVPMGELHKLDPNAPPQRELAVGFIVRGMLQLPEGVTWGALREAGLVTLPSTTISGGSIANEGILDLHRLHEVAHMPRPQK